MTDNVSPAGQQGAGVTAAQLQHLKLQIVSKHPAAG